MKKLIICILLISSITLIGCSSNESDIVDDLGSNVIEITDEPIEPTQEVESTITEEPTISPEIVDETTPTEIEITNVPTEVIPTEVIPEITDNPIITIEPTIIEEQPTPVEIEDPTTIENTLIPTYVEEEYPAPTAFTEIATSIIIDDLDTYIAYPNNSNIHKYCIEEEDLGAPISTDFIFNGIEYQINDENREEVAQYSIDNHIYTSGLLNFAFTDLNTYNRISLTDRIYNAIDYMQIGTYKFTTSDLMCNPDKFVDFIPSLKDIYGLETLEAKKIEECNDFGGPTYGYEFSINDIENEYTEEELNYLYENGYGPLNGLIVIRVYKNALHENVMYTFNYNKLSHFMVQDMEDINEDGTSIQYKMITQNGYNYDNSYLKLKDGSIILYSNINIEMHNPNKKIYLDGVVFDIDRYEKEISTRAPQGQ